MLRENYGQYPIDHWEHNSKYITALNTNEILPIEKVVTNNISLNSNWKVEALEEYASI